MSLDVRRELFDTIHRNQMAALMMEVNPYKAAEDGVIPWFVPSKEESDETQEEEGQTTSDILR